MKNAPAIALVLLMLLLTAACSAAPATERVAGPAASPSGLAASLPKPNAAQQEALLASLANINPAFSHEGAVDRARGLCGRLLGQSSAEQLIAAAKTAFSGGDAPAVSDEDAQRILSVIGSNGFCR